MIIRCANITRALMAMLRRQNDDGALPLRITSDGASLCIFRQGGHNLTDTELAHVRGVLAAHAAEPFTDPKGNAMRSTTSNLDRTATLTAEEDDAEQAFDAEQGKSASDDTLTVDGSLETWSVTDSNGGRWWPSDEAEIAINAASSPADEALRICTAEPMRGEWHS